MYISINEYVNKAPKQHRYMLQTINLQLPEWLRSQSDCQQF